MNKFLDDGNVEDILACTAKVKNTFFKNLFFTNIFFERFIFKNIFF